jgi:predicted HTH domain antitoxin
MGALKLEIPEEVLRSLKLPPGEVEMELRKELALALYRRGVLSLGKARQLVGMTRWQFEELLGERRVARHYTEKDLAEDQAYARSDH